ncbi:MAG: hypothetical protein Q4C53_06840 [Clostridia bacterium]|nr:hypothetical protein [Clostridia bacterium]
MCVTEKLLKKHGASFRQVMYATRDGRRTVLHLENGQTVETFLPIKRILAEAPAGLFACVNKGVILSLGHIASTEGNEYVMTDGSRFRCRARQKALTPAAVGRAHAGRWEDWEKYAVLDEFPLAFCVIELVFDGAGHGIDFIFRYCNKEMEALEGKRIGEMIDRSFYEVFENGDKKWLVAYADVALNGVKRTIESYSPEIDADLKIYCYQPKPNFCACTLVRLQNAE